MNGILKVGEPLKRFEDESLLRGEGLFVDNLDMQDQVFLIYQENLLFPLMNLGCVFLQ